MKAAELRQAILQAAVQGKLAPQNVHDEPASELLERIRQEKAQLVKEGKIKKEKALPSIVKDEVPYDLPDGWVWCRLQNVVVSDITYGIIKLGDEDNNGVKVLRCSDVKFGFIDLSGIRTVSIELSEEYSRTILQGGEILVNVRGTLGGVAIASDKFRGYNIAREVAMVRCSNQIVLKYMLSILMSPTFGFYLAENLRGIAYKGLNMNLLSMFLFPLPPLSEQHRIVEKVDELMVMCDELEAAEKDLDVLENRFAEYLPKSILQAAVQGKLVPQNIHDEPATKLLERIRGEKSRLVKQGKIKKDPPLPPIAEDGIPYDLPDGWVWCRLSTVATIYTGNSISENDKKSKYTGLSNGHFYIATKDIDQSNHINYDNGIKIPFNNTNFRVAPESSVLLCIEGGSAGKKVAITNQDVCFVNKLCCFTCYELDSRYLFYYLKSPVFFSLFKLKMTGIIGGVGVNSIKELLFPLPPLAEQQRIVAKVDELMALCDELKTAKEYSYKKTTAHVVPFLRQGEDELEIGIAARGEMQGLSNEAAHDIKEMFGDDCNG